MDLASHLFHWGDATTTDLLGADGFTADAVAKHLRAGELRRVRRAAFIRGGELLPSESFLLASVAVARTRPGHLLGGRSAVAALGLPVLGLPADRRVTLVRPGAGVTRCPGKDLLVQRLDVEPHVLSRWSDVRAVPPAIAVAMAGALDAHTGIAAADAAVRAGLARVEELVEAASCVGLRRPLPLERLLERADIRSESPGESVLRLLLENLGIRVVPQVTIRDQENRFVARVDLLDKKSRTIYEFDGAVKYAGADGQTNLVAEKRREDQLRRLKYSVVRVTWADLTPAGIMALVPQRNVA